MFATPFLPLQVNGGPITNHGATMLTNGNPPFRLNQAQWVFLMEGWEPKGSLTAKPSEISLLEPGSWAEEYSVHQSREGKAHTDFGQHLFWSKLGKQSKEGLGKHLVLENIMASSYRRTHRRL